MSASSSMYRYEDSVSTAPNLISQQFSAHPKKLNCTVDSAESGDT